MGLPTATRAIYARDAMRDTLRDRRTSGDQSS